MNDSQLFIDKYSQLFSQLFINTIFFNQFIIFFINSKIFIKIIEKSKDLIEMKDEEIKNVMKYKEEYNQVCKSLFSLFNEWSSKLIVFFDSKSKEEPLQADLNNPIQILSIFEKMFKVSTPNGMQKYLRKIILSASSLHKKYLNDFPNERYDPDKVYFRISQKFGEINKIIEAKNQEIENLKILIENFEENEKKKKKNYNFFFFQKGNIIKIKIIFYFNLKFE